MARRCSASNAERSARERRQDTPLEAVQQLLSKVAEGLSKHQTGEADVERAGGGKNFLEQATRNKHQEWWGRREPIRHRRHISGSCFRASQTISRRPQQTEPTGAAIEVTMNAKPRIAAAPTEG